MKKAMKISLQILLVSAFDLLVIPVNAQKSLNTQEYVTVTMDMQGVLELNMSTDPQVDFVFNSVQKYQSGITKFNATVLQVNSTVPWDLYVQSASQYWTQNAAYGASTSGQNVLPAEILELQCSQPNYASEAANFNNFNGLYSNFGSNTASSAPGYPTQFLAGYFGNNIRPLTRSAENQTIAAVGNRFAIHYRIRPGLPAVFPNLAKEYPAVAKTSFPTAESYAQPGYYELEVVYSLVEDL